MADVFVSYKRCDAPLVARAVAAIEAHGLTVWWDRLLAPGRCFVPALVREIEAARVVLVCWSAPAVRSPWVGAEAAGARRRGKYFGAVLRGGAPPAPFDALPSVDLRGWGGDGGDPLCRALVSALAQAARLEGGGTGAMLAQGDRR